MCRHKKIKKQRPRFHFWKSDDFLPKAGVNSQLLWPIFGIYLKYRKMRHRYVVDVIWHHPDDQNSQKCDSISGIHENSWKSCWCACIAMNFVMNFHEWKFTKIMAMHAHRRFSWFFKNHVPACMLDDMQKSRECATCMPQADSGQNRPSDVGWYIVATCFIGTIYFFQNRKSRQGKPIEKNRSGPAYCKL